MQRSWTRASKPRGTSHTHTRHLCLSGVLHMFHHKLESPPGNGKARKEIGACLKRSPRCPFRTVFQRDLWQQSPALRTHLENQPSFLFLAGRCVPTVLVQGISDAHQSSWAYCPLEYPLLPDGSYLTQPNSSTALRARDPNVSARAAERKGKGQPAGVQERRSAVQGHQGSPAPLPALLESSCLAVSVEGMGRDPRRERNYSPAEGQKRLGSKSKGKQRLASAQCQEIRPKGWGASLQGGKGRKLMVLILEGPQCHANVNTVFGSRKKN